jgi:hypothetical protein
MLTATLSAGRRSLSSVVAAFLALDRRQCAELRTSLYEMHSDT